MKEQERIAFFTTNSPKDLREFMRALCNNKQQFAVSFEDDTAVLSYPVAVKPPLSDGSPVIAEQTHIAQAA